MSKYAMLPYRRPNELSQLFNDFDRSFFTPFPSFSAAFNTDITDEGDHYLMAAELPGFGKDDISIDVEGDQLVIRASREQEKEEDKKKYIHRERTYGTYTRRFDISGIDTEHIGAKYNNGVLELTLPKVVEKAPEGKKITID